MLVFTQQKKVGYKESIYANSTKKKLSEQNLRLHYLLDYGSQTFNLHTKDSDYDYLVVVSQDPFVYLGLNEPNNTWSNLTDGKFSYQFMDLKRFYQLSSSSNFTLYVGLQNIVDMNGYAPYPNPFTFSLRKLAHHCLGLITNKSQRQYMKAYSYLFVQYLMQHQRHPESLRYDYLLNETDNVDDAVVRVLELKKQGVKYTELTIQMPYSHEDVNVLADNKLDFNEAWIQWLRRRIIDA